MKWSTNSWICSSVKVPFLRSALSVDVDEGGGAADGHGSAVLVLHGSQVGEVHPLDGLLGVGGRTGDVEAVQLAELDELLEGADLLGQLLAIADGLLGHDGGRGSLLGLLVGDQGVDAVEGDAAVVADDAAAAVAVGQTGDDVSGAAGAHLRGVGVEHAGVVRLALVGVEVDDLGIDLVAVLGSGLAGDADAAVDVQGALERGVGLQADDGLALRVLGVDVAGLVGQNARHDLGVHVQDAALLALLEKQRHDVIPQLDGTLGGTHQERLVALVRGVVLLVKKSRTSISLSQLPPSKPSHASCIA